MVNNIGTNLPGRSTSGAGDCAGSELTVHDTGMERPTDLLDRVASRLRPRGCPARPVPGGFAAEPATNRYRVNLNEAVGEPVHRRVAS